LSVAALYSPAVHRRWLLTALLAPLLLTAARAAPEVERSAPRESSNLVLSGKHLSIAYGRPLLRGRSMFGVLVPWGKVWRTGADEATKLSTEVDLRFGAGELPKGNYAVFTIPGERDWQLVLNKTADQWGAFNYDPSEDALRVPMRRDSLAAPIDRLSIALTARGEAAGTLWIGWETTVVSADFELVPEPASPAAPEAPPQ
jgi:hypothetical protein